MKIAVLTSRYPTEKEPYNHMFVHTRNREYVEKGVYVSVFVPSKNKYFYTFEGINVYRLPTFEIIKKLESFDITFIHLLHTYPIKEIDGSIIYNHIIKFEIPVLFFIHGIEVQKISKSYKDEVEITNPKSILRALYHDFYQIPKIKKIIKSLLNYSKCRFISVSKWMLKEVYDNLKINLSSKAVVIPNGIDTNLFVYDNHWNYRYKVLTLRPLILKGKYALDLAVLTMKHIKQDKVNLTIYGKGKDESKIKDFINKQELSRRVKIINKFLQHKEIPIIHKNFGLYYAVTRMDAQGVSMCEAMASGLPVISFNVCGIPEFVKHNKTGILIEPFNIQEAANWIENLTYDKNLYIRISENARKFIETIDIKNTTQKELDIAKSLM
ncbi:glycosyltransferase family 4 protein [Phorcysia thermohydrogeniphila]|uniref:Glycosyltransferase involved in cell wall biosynthesis n=1 Tax=Phorcysia thermohydrogeniphila TaxID=936138 RepID=A0A4V2PDB1_9BACT|nr:glycosyltransferase family 4 protein [Phorcysia thermohydrogeniphila]TCK04456.1 glycosyltransferase involved in cell wall biosynthesis [Phorcysia thermohydrogeniphila]